MLQMTQVTREATAVNHVNQTFTQIDSSQTQSFNSPKQHSIQTVPTRKRIGPYSYRLTDVVGSGFSSIVYKGCKDGDRQQVFAIKVVKIGDMNEHRRKMLEFEVKVLKLVEHPHIIRFVDLYYTRNNYYIITEYCEGGSLQSLINREQKVDWPQICYQMGMACSYLASKHIMHRDVKPANVLLKNGICKLSDFGFTYLFSQHSILKENYLIGSPLYMPIESLQDHEYSTKNDSFALGVCIYYLITKRFPWKSKNKEELIKNYTRKSYNKKYIAHLPPKLKHLISGLLQIKPEKRLHLSDCEFQVFLHVGATLSIPQQLSTLKGKYSQQLNLCEFIHYLFKNYSLQFWQVNSYLPKYLARHLQSITSCFGWQKHEGLQRLQQRYPIPEVGQQFISDDYYWLNNCLKDVVRVLADRSQNKAQVMLQKLLNYQQVVEALLAQDSEKIVEKIGKLVIHADFSGLRAQTKYIGERLANIDFYQL